MPQPNHPLSKSLSLTPLYTTLLLTTTTTTLTQLTHLHHSLTLLGGNRHGIATAQKSLTRQDKFFTTSLANVKQGRWYTLVTSLFNHGSWSHFWGNVYFLIGFGKRLSAVPFMVLFYGGGIFGMGTCLGLDYLFASSPSNSHSPSDSSSQPSSSTTTLKTNDGHWWVPKTLRKRLRRHRPGTYLGCSGGISAIMAYQACLFPYEIITANIGPLTVTQPFWVHVCGFMAYSIWAQGSEYNNDGVAHLAHLGGMIWGVGCWGVYRLWKRRLV